MTNWELTGIAIEWEFIWKTCLMTALAIFLIVAVVVSIGGARDIRRMLSRLK